MELSDCSDIIQMLVNYQLSRFGELVLSHSGEPVNCNHSEVPDWQTVMKALALVVMVCAALGDGSALSKTKVDAKFSRNFNLRKFTKKSKFLRKTQDGRYAQDSPISQPVCSLHKIAMCTKNKDFHHGNCQKFRNKQPGGKAAHCEQENCHVHKKVGCVAIIPARMKDTAHKVLGADLSAYTNECKHAINPCDAAALYM